MIETLLAHPELLALGAIVFLVFIFLVTHRHYRLRLAGQRFELVFEPHSAVKTSKKRQNEAGADHT
jgi:hypothetical protein